MELFLLTTPLALILSAAVFLLGPIRGFPYLMASLPLGAGAAFNLPSLGGASVLVGNLTAAAYLAGCLVCPAFLQRLRGVLRPEQTGFQLSLFVFFALGVTYLAPQWFANQTVVFSIERGVESEIIEYSPLHSSTGNITQGLYFLQSVLIFLAVRASFREEDFFWITRGFLVATIVHLFLAGADLLTYTLGLTDWMGLIQTANYTILSESTLGGLKRIVAGFSEASTCGGFTLGLLGFWIGYWLGGGSRMPWIQAGLLSLVLLFSTASSAYAAGVMFLFILLSVLVLKTLLQRTSPRENALLSISTVAGIMAVCMLLLVMVVSTEVYEFFDRVAFSKLSSDSGVERGRWNESAFQNFLDTGYLGAGLGSVRGSSLLFSLLGTLGIVGLCFYVWLIVRLVDDFLAERMSQDSEVPAVRTGAAAVCLALFCNYLLINSSPDMGLTWMIAAALLGLGEPDWKTATVFLERRSFGMVGGHP